MEEKGRGGCRAGWVRKGLGGLVSDAYIIDQLGGKKNMRTEDTGR